MKLKQKQPEKTQRSLENIKLDRFLINRQRLENKLKVPGVYSITCIKNNKRYIGSSKNIFHRLEIHISDLKRDKHHSVLLQRAFKKYGSKNFLFEVLEILDTTENIVKREQFWLDNFKSYDKNLGYNILQKAFSCLGIIVSEKTKIKLRMSHLGQKAWNKGLNKNTDLRVLKNSLNTSKTLKNRYAEGFISPLKGRKHSDKQNKQHSIFMLGRFSGNKNYSYKQINKNKLLKMLKNKMSIKHIQKELGEGEHLIYRKTKEFWGKTPKQMKGF